MDRYQIMESVGKGTYGEVFKAVNKETQEIVAVKRAFKKYYSWDEAMALREIKSLRKLSHTNVIKLKEVIRVKDELNFVFDFLDKNLYDVIKVRTSALPEERIKAYFLQILEGLAYVHKQGFFHRDLKPENILYHAASDTLKIADFGLAREIRSQPPYTDYVSTRWYRAPELTLRANSYSSPVDMFAAGCILAELYIMRPLFPGTTSMDQLCKICQLLGTPTNEEWGEGYKLASKMSFNFPKYTESSIQQIIPQASSDAIDLMKKLMTFDPRKRLTAAAALQHPFFSGVISVSRTITNDKPIGEEQKSNPKDQHFTVEEDEFGQPIDHREVDQLLDDFDQIDVGSGKKPKMQHLDTRRPIETQGFGRQGSNQGFSPVKFKDNNVTVKQGTDEILAANFKTQQEPQKQLKPSLSGSRLGSYQAFGGGGIGHTMEKQNSALNGFNTGTQKDSIAPGTSPNRKLGDYSYYKQGASTTGLGKGYSTHLGGGIGSEKSGSNLGRHQF